MVQFDQAEIEFLMAVVAKMGIAAEQTNALAPVHRSYLYRLHNKLGRALIDRSFEDSRFPVPPPSVN